MNNKNQDTEMLILVDESDRQTGELDKLAVHQRGLLHRAFSVFILNNEGRILLQKRAASKYHSPGLWSNTCCSHPRVGEEVIDAAKRRLMEEMGLQCDIREAFSFIYKAEFDNGLIEHEFDHVFFGTSDNIPVPEPAEVADWKYVSPEQLSEDMRKNPGDYTEWLKICFPRVREHLAAGR